MSIYVLRSRDLYKIGFSSNLPERVGAIMAAVPGASQFVGHMPGGMDVEAHLHERFSAERFSGEWFTESPRLLAFIDACLSPELPAPAIKRGPGHYRNDAARVALSEQLRRACALKWPEHNHKQRISKLAEELAWAERRARSVYHCERYTLLASEAPVLDRWLSEWIAPELAEPTQKTPTSLVAGACETKGE